MNLIRRLDSRAKLKDNGEVHWRAFICEKKQGAIESELSFHEAHPDICKNDYLDYRRFWAKTDETETKLPGLCIIKQHQWSEPTFSDLQPKPSRHQDDIYGPYHWDIHCPCQFQSKRLAYLATENKVLCPYEKQPSGERRPSDPNFEFGRFPTPER